jgi:hypothetical protein
MKHCLLTFFSLVLAFASPAAADEIVPHTDITASDKIVESINNFNFSGETLRSNTDLILGKTTRYTSSGDVHTIGKDGADNFDLTDGTSRSDPSDNTLAYMETIFGSRSVYKTFYIFEYNGNESGTIQAIYESGLGEPIVFDNKFGNTGVARGYLAVLVLDSPAKGIRINSCCFDALSVSAQNPKTMPWVPLLLLDE